MFYIFFKFWRWIILKKLLTKILRFSGLPLLFREVIQRNKVTILLFHDLKIESAEKIFEYLSDNYNLISLNEFIEACKKKDKSKIPKKAAIITLDDGHIANYEILPIVKKYNVPITIFLCAGIINSNRHFWFRHKQLLIPVSALKQKSNKEKITILSKTGFEPEKEFDQPQALTKSQINDMKSFINMQSHTIFHPCLTKCDYAEAKIEIFHSKEILENDYGLIINTLSYPNGDYTDREIALAKEAGYECGITVDYGYNTIYTDLFRLKRICLDDSYDLDNLVVKSSGLWQFFKSKLNKNYFE